MGGWKRRENGGVRDNVWREGGRKDLMTTVQGVNEGGGKGERRQKRGIKGEKEGVRRGGGKTRQRWRADVCCLDSQIKQESLYCFALTV